MIGKVFVTLWSFINWSFCSQDWLWNLNKINIILTHPDVLVWSGFCFIATFSIAVAWFCNARFRMTSFHTWYFITFCRALSVKFKDILIWEYNLIIKRIPGTLNIFTRKKKNVYFVYSAFIFQRPSKRSSLMVCGKYKGWIYSREKKTDIP